MLSVLFVAVLNIPLLIWGERLTLLVSNDPDVQRWFGKLIWVLVLHAQLQIGCKIANVLFIPMGKATFQILLQLVSYYLIATPPAVIIALTDIVTSSVYIKLIACLATTPMAALLVATFGFGYLALMDWNAVMKIINDRANNDKDK